MFFLCDRAAGTGANGLSDTLGTRVDGKRASWDGSGRMTDVSSEAMVPFDGAGNLEGRSSGSCPISAYPGGTGAGRGDLGKTT